MKTSKSPYVIYVVVYSILTVMLNIIYFVIPFPKSASAWIAYGFAFLSIFVSAAITYFAFLDGVSLESKILGFPVFKVGISYLICQTIFSISIFALELVVKVPYWIPLAVSLIGLCVALLGSIAADSTRNAVTSVQDSTREKMKKITYFKMDISGIVDSCKDMELKPRLKHLEEEFQYSDPISSEALEEIESKISAELEKLAILINKGTAADVINKIDFIENLLSDRNRRCKALKR